MGAVHQEVVFRTRLNEVYAMQMMLLPL